MRRAVHMRAVAALRLLVASVASLSAGAAGASFGACGGAGNPERMEQAKAALAPYKKALKATLEKALAEGPEAAIAACAEAAPALATQMSTPAARVGRTSDRLRNPANRAPDWLQPLVADLDGPRLVDLGEGRHGYAEPILLGEMCVTCHGRDLAPGLRATLAARYPEDRATGYAAGDRRGAFWVELAPGR